MNVKNTLQERLRDMRPSEAEVTRRLLRNLALVAEKNLREVAAWCRSSDTTVMRACRAAGYDGFQDLKYHVLREFTGGPIPDANWPCWICFSAGSDRGPEISSMKTLLATAIAFLMPVISTEPGKYDWVGGASSVARCLLDNTPSLITPEHGLHVLEVMNACHESQRTGHELVPYQARLTVMCWIIERTRAKEGSGVEAVLRPLPGRF